MTDDLYDLSGLAASLQAVLGGIVAEAGAGQVAVPAV